jgi:hypothetical protein
MAWQVKDEGPTVLFQGALANAFASFVGNYPWYLTFNTLDETLPLAPTGDLALKLCRAAALGISAACVSDCLSNSIRVLKTTRQTSATTLSYQDAVRRWLSIPRPLGCPLSLSLSLCWLLASPLLTERPVDRDAPPQAKSIIEKDGVRGLLGRGLGTRIVTNALQAALCTHAPIERRRASAPCQRAASVPCQRAVPARRASTRHQAPTQAPRCAQPCSLMCILNAARGRFAVTVVWKLGEEYIAKSGIL